MAGSEINCERVTLANNIDEFDADNPSFAKRPGVAKVVHLGSGKNVVKSQAEQERNKPNIEHNAVMGTLFELGYQGFCQASDVMKGDGVKS